MTPQELETKLKSLGETMDQQKKDFQIQVDAIKKDAENWKAVATQKEDELKKFQEQAEIEKVEATKKASEARQAEAKSFVESLVKEGKLIPAQKESVIAFMNSLAAEGEVHTFAMKDGSKKSHSQLSLFKEFLNTPSKTFQYGSVSRAQAHESDLPGGEESPAEFMEVLSNGNKIQVPVQGSDMMPKVYELMETKKISYSDALIEVSKQEKLTSAK